MQEIFVTLEDGTDKMLFIERSCNNKRDDPKTSIDIKIESKEAYICTLDECNDKVVGGSGFQNVLNILALMPLLFMI